MPLDPPVGQLVEKRASDIGGLVARRIDPGPAHTPVAPDGIPEPSGGVAEAGVGLRTVTQVLVPADGHQRELAAHLGDPRPDRAYGKGVPVQEEQRVARLGVLHDHPGQLVELLGMGALEIGGDVEPGGHRRVVDAVE